MILLTDFLFPSKYAKWRIEEIKAFMDTDDCDILVSKLDKFASIDYEVDYEEMDEYYSLKDFNILIFDSKYNYLNKYNTRIDGTQYNRTDMPYSYLFTKKVEFDLKNYDKIYHIFLTNYTLFNEHFKFPQHKQFIHLYPGGGFSASSDLSNVHKLVRIISTQPKSTYMLDRHNHRNYINVFGSTLLGKDEIPTMKHINNGTVRVCFSVMGSTSLKGYGLYNDVVNRYVEKYPDDDIEWLHVGTTHGIIDKNPNITYYSPMSQTDLDAFYNSEVDILINSEGGKQYNGWPLGAEAALQGVVLLTTDSHDNNKHFKYTPDMLEIIANDCNKIVESVRDMYVNREKLHTRSMAIQRHTHDIFSYQHQQMEILNYVYNSKPVYYRPVAVEKYVRFCPPVSYQDSIFSIDGIKNTYLEDRSVQVLETDIRSKICNSLKNNIPITLARYNDGEWIALLRTAYDGLFDRVFKNWGASGQKFVDEQLWPIIKSRPEYLIGISTEVSKKRYIMDYAVPHIKGLKLFDGGLFSRWGIENDMVDMIDSLEGRKVILVGPQYLNRIKGYYDIEFTHVDSGNDKKSWEEYDRIRNELFAVIDDTEYPVILYCASFVAKKLIDEVYNARPTATQLDIGAAFNGYCNKFSRPWHEYMQ